MARSSMWQKQHCVKPSKLFFAKKLPKDGGTAQQIIGREGETATFLKTSLVSPTLRGGGFAPRQFNRSALSGEIRQSIL